MVAKLHLKLEASAINPIMGGPNTNPKKPMEDTAAMATLALTFFVLPAMLYTVGTTDDTPKPTKKKPSMAVGKYGNDTATANPNATSKPQMRITAFLPYLVIMPSLMNLPIAIVHMKDAYPIMAKFSGTFTIVLK